jgi:hypothetical protein
MAMSSDAAHQKKARERRKNGLVCFRVEAVENDLAEALIRSGRLSEDEAARQRRVERELGTVLREWAARWLDRHA